TTLAGRGQCQKKNRSNCQIKGNHYPNEPFINPGNYVAVPTQYPSEPWKKNVVEPIHLDSQKIWAPRWNFFDLNPSNWIPEYEPIAFGTAIAGYSTNGVLWAVTAAVDPVLSMPRAPDMWGSTYGPGNAHWRYVANADCEPIFLHTFDPFL